jgi:hypothetical protein
MVLMLLATFGMKAPAGNGDEASHVRVLNQVLTALILPDRHA